MKTFLLFGTQNKKNLAARPQPKEIKIVKCAEERHTSPENHVQKLLSEEARRCGKVSVRREAPRPMLFYDCFSLTTQAELIPRSRGDFKLEI
jgi:hypothetical protein